MQWKFSENSDSIKPLEVDNTSSKVYVFVRKNFELIEATEERPAHWQYQETKIKKEDWELFETLMSHEEQLTDTTIALMELAQIQSDSLTDVEDINNALIELANLIEEKFNG